MIKAMTPTTEAVKFIKLAVHTEIVVTFSVVDFVHDFVINQQHEID